MKGGGAMRRRNWMLAALLTAAVVIVTAMAARAEPTLPDDSPNIPVVGTTGPETTAPDMSITVPTEPESTVDYSATDEYGSTIYATTTARPTTTTKRTARTEPPFVVNPAYPNDTNAGPTPYAPIPNFNEFVTDQYGNRITIPVTVTTTEDATETSAEEASAPEDEESFSDIPEEVERSAIHWAAALAAGAALLAALAGVIFMLARSRKGDDEDDYIYEDEQQ